MILDLNGFRFPGYYKEYKENKEDKEQRLVEEHAYESKQTDEAPIPAYL
jgi:hypothetical protein